MRLAWQVYRPLAAVTAVAVVALAAGCSTAASGSQASGGGSSTGKKIVVVAAENFWGSIARQLGGSHVTETSIITNPDTDPHDYEPTAGDARTIAVGAAGDRQRDRVRPVGAEAALGQPGARPLDADRRRTCSG